MKHRYWYIIGFAVVVSICVSAFVLAPNGEFGGADDRGSNQIEQINPDYRPWFESLWTPPAETQSLLFAVQAAIGASIIGFFIGNERGKKLALKQAKKMKEIQAKAVKVEATDE